MFVVHISDQDMDGKAIAAGLATCPVPDWFKDVVVKVGLQLKVHTALRTLYNNSQVHTGLHFVMYHSYFCVDLSLNMLALYTTVTGISSLDWRVNC